MGLALIKGLGLGAGLMYFLDPDLGRRRRAMVTDQFARAGHPFEGFLGTASRDLANRTRGVTAELGRRFRDEPPPSDEILVERIRATIGHHVAHPRAIEVAALNGHVVLRGPVPASELDGLIRAVNAVPGVVDVADELELRREGDDPAVRGGRGRTRMGWEPWQQDWPPAAKLLAGAAGVALALRLAGRGPITGLALGGLGLALAGGLSEGRAGASGQASSGARADEASRRESGWPGGGRGRTDVTGRSGIYPASGPLPPGDAEIRTPAQLVRGQFDEQGRQVEGGSELTNREGALLGGATPPPSSPTGDQATPGGG